MAGTSMGCRCLLSRPESCWSFDHTGRAMERVDESRGEAGGGDLAQVVKDQQLSCLIVCWYGALPAPINMAALYLACTWMA